MKKLFFAWLIRFIIITFISIIVFIFFQYLSQARYIRANLIIDAKKITGLINENWRAYAQGGEEKGKRMLENVIDPIAALFPKYIRIDHIYDFYDVVSKDQKNQLIFNWEKLDETICDIYHTGARPFLVLGYMPKALSEDGTLTGKPKDWENWSLLVQKTIERYSGKDTILCQSITGKILEDTYYEIWNEPDLEFFGKWSHWGGKKDYKLLYYYSIKGAEKAKNVYRFHIGGPATTGLYKNWITVLLDYILTNNLRIDFISWHHYSKNPDDFYQDMKNLNTWLSESKYLRFQSIPKIISEWGYDSQPNPLGQTEIGAAHAVYAVRHMIDQNLYLGFSFEIKDGPQPSWGMLDYAGNKKLRYYSFAILNKLDRYRLDVQGEGTFVKAIASYSYNNKITIILVNYDQNNKNTELVPLTIKNLPLGNYIISEERLGKQNITQTKINLSDSILKKSVLMTPNSIVVISLQKEN